jgi:hypothetical protein
MLCTVSGASSMYSMAASFRGAALLFVALSRLALPYLASFGRAGVYSTQCQVNTIRVAGEGVRAPAPTCQLVPARIQEQHSTAQPSTATQIQKPLASSLTLRAALPCPVQMRCAGASPGSPSGQLGGNR